jgi:hypothetical protein
MCAVGPFLAAIAPRSNETVQSLWDQLMSGEVHPHVVMDGDTPMALIGTRLLQRADGYLGEIVWATGFDQTAWFHLIDGLEAWLEARGCTAVRALCRPGWGKFLAGKDYRKSHEIWDKVLD